MHNKIMILLGMSVLASGAVFAESGRINFNGEIIDTACVVDAGADNTINVLLGKISAKEFTRSGATAATTEFNINLKDCPKDTTATIKFEGKAKDGSAQILDLTKGEDTATGIGIQILDGKNMSELPLNADSGTYTITAGETTLPFFARYVSTADTVTAGPADSVANFTVAYN